MATSNHDAGTTTDSGDERRGWLVGIDIGGTFTDVVAMNIDSNVLRAAKVPSRRDAPVQAIVEGLAAVAVAPHEVESLIHGTTRVTNAIVEEKLPPVAFITTAGFEDTLAIARLRRRELYRLDVPPRRDPLVPGERCFGVKERIAHTGEIIDPLDDESVTAVCQAVADAGVQSVAVSLLHAYADPEHERRLGERLREQVRHVSLSHIVNPEAREFERASSTVLNAATMPIAVEYIDQLLAELPLENRLQLFHSAGGWATPADVRQRPLTMALSGPAAGVAASARLAESLGLENVLTFDMGGTTTDVCLIVDGKAQVTDTREIGDRPLRMPMLAVHSIGAGGGSIVKLTPGGLLVGPESSGAEPGPACYGHGGTEPTVTDANVVLGYLSSRRNLGGSIRIDRELAERALQPIADGLGRGLVETALGIVRVANANMARALRRVTVERGLDGRRSTLLAFGGAGPMHAVGLATEFGIGEVLVPALSSGFSAHGCLLSDMAYAHQRTIRMRQSDWTTEAFEAIVSEMLGELRAPLLASGVADQDIEAEFIALVRYDEQSDAVPVPFTRPLSPARLGADFTAVHQALYGYATDEPWIIEGLRLRVAAPSRVDFPDAGSDPTGVDAVEDTCWFDANGPEVTRRYDRGALSSESAVAGPAIVEDAWSTIIIPPGWSGRTDRLGNLLMREEPE